MELCVHLKLIVVVGFGLYNWSCFCIVTAGASPMSPPEITITDNTVFNTSDSLITPKNSTHYIISKNLTSIVMKCQASYPVMWSLRSLDQAWVSGTQSERIVGDFKDSSTYKYSMTVKLTKVANNHIPEEFTCHSADLSNNLTSKLSLIWESRTSPFLSTIKNLYENGSYHIYWSDIGSSAPGVPILIPCYSVNVKETKVDLYKREANQTLTFISSEKNSNVLRFEPYVGFFLNSSILRADSEIYECHAKRVEVIEITTTTTTPVPSISEILKRNFSEFDWLDDLDYLYVEDLEDAMLENTTYNTELHMTPGTKVPGSLDAVVFSLIKANAATFNRTISVKRPDVLASYFNMSNQNLLLTESDSFNYHITCCIKSGITGIYANHTADNILLHYRKCVEPLMCLTRNHVLKRTYIPYYSRDDSYHTARCRTMSKLILDEYNPNVYICHMSPDRKYTRSYYGGYFEPNEEDYETSYLVQQTHFNTSTFIHFEYQSLNDNNKKRQWTPVMQGLTTNIFYIGDTVLFRCKASPFLYAVGIVWEKEWKNGTTEITQTNHTTSALGSNYVELSVELLNEDLKRVSCHIPPWNSTTWMTQSIPLTIKPSTAPVSPSGESLAYENVTFYTRQSVDLHCNFSAQPPPKFKWNTTSLVYSADNIGAKSYPYEPSPTTTVSIGYTWNYNVNASTTIPAEQFSCVASNLAGNATKTFNIQAIRSFSPTIGHAAREVVVIFFNDENSLLNCTITQGMPLPQFSWRRHGVNISTFDNYETRAYDTESSLIFKKVRYEDEGDYTCVAQNFVGSATKEFSVRVRERSHSRHWYEFTVAVLAIALIGMFGFLAYVYVTKMKTISRLEMRAEYTKSLDKHESRCTVATLVDD